MSPLETKMAAISMETKHGGKNDSVFLSIFFIQIIIKKFIVHLMYNEMSGLKNEQNSFSTRTSP